MSIEINSRHRDGHHHNGQHLNGRRILVIKNRAIGDTILLTGALRLLRKHRPHHEIHVLVRSPAGELLEGLPYVDRIISVKEPKGRLGRFGYWMNLLRRLRAQRYELALNFHASFRSSATAKLMRVDTCVANHHELRGRNWFSDLPVPGRGQVKSIIDRDLDVLRAIGIEAAPEEAMPEIVLTPYERREAAALFAGERTGSGPLIFLGVGGSRETKRWPADHMVTVAKRLVEKFDARFVMSTIDIDKPWMSKFWPVAQAEPTVSGRIRHFSNQTLRQTANIMSQCSIYIGNDSGLKHLAVALGLRTLTMFGPEMPMEWHPYDTRWHPYAFIDGLPCRISSGKHWCSISTCTVEAHRCMREISPAQIWDDLVRIVECC